PDAKREIPADKLFDGSISEDVVLIPTAEGTYTLPGAVFTYFDPSAGQYRTVTTPDTELVVEGSSLAAPPLPPPPAGSADSTTGSAGSAAPPPAIRTTPAPESPAALPRDPLP